MRGEEQVSARSQYSRELFDPVKVKRFREVREHRPGVNEVKLLVLVFEPGFKAVDLELGERQVLPAPRDQIRVVIRAVQICLLELVPVPHNPSETAAEIQDRIEVFDG
jgi:hypothetical protein